MIAVATVVFIGLARPLPAVRLVAARAPDPLPGRLTGLAWPDTGEAAVGVEGAGLIDSYGSDRPVPIASVTKVMTAYLILRDHALGPSDSGPRIAVGRRDVEDYEADADVGESATPVTDGERITEFEALEALLLPSADNIAALLARWDAGSEAAFVAKMNSEARVLGLRQTHYADAAGVMSATTSTAADQVRLAMVALREPTLAKIVASRQASVPVAGRLHNLDALLGSHGIVGGKTGYTSAAGACFVFAAHERAGGRLLTVFGAVLGQPRATRSNPLPIAFHATTALLASVPRLIKVLTLGHEVTLAWVRAPWTRPVAVRLARPVSFVGWPGLVLRVRIRQTHGLTAPVRAGGRVGVAELSAGRQRARVKVVAADTLPSASVGWRLTHP